MTDLPDVKLKALVTFPADVRGVGVAVTKDNGVVNLTVGTPWSRTLLDDNTVVEARNTLGITTSADVKPLVFLATGQSNFESDFFPFAWSPSPNLLTWNFVTDGVPGTAFVTVQNASINVPEKISSDIANANPDRRVYIINISIGSQAISHWMVGTTAPDMFANIVANVVPALASIGISRIDGLFWWQGENQTTTPELYVDNFNTVMDRFKAQSWFPRETPVIVFSTAPSVITGDAVANNDAVNAALQACVRAEPDVRRFVYTGTLLDPIYWEAVANPLHPSPLGASVIGGMGANAFTFGETHQPLLWPLTGSLANGAIGRPALRNLWSGGDLTTNPWPYGTNFVSIPTNTAFLEDVTWFSSGGGVVDIRKTADAPTMAQAGMFTQHCIDIQVTTADIDTSGFNLDYYGIMATIRARDASFLGFGQAGALPLVVSFWVKATITGNYFVTVENSAQTRSFNSQFTINAANTWEKKRVIIKGDQAGAWLYDAGVGLRVFITMAAGGGYLFTPDVWNVGDVRVGNVTRANCMSVVGNRFKVALLQVEEGVYPSAFDRTPSNLINNVQVLAASAIKVNNTGSVAEVTLATIPVPAYAMRKNGILRITAQYSYVSVAAGNWTPHIRFGGVDFWSNVNTSAGLSGRFQTQIANRGVTNAQIGNGAQQVNWSSTTSAIVTAAIDTTVAQNITLTAQLANAADSVALESYLVELILPP